MDISTERATSFYTGGQISSSDPIIGGLLSTRLQHAVLLNSRYKGKNMRVLEVMGCRSLVATALVAKARGHGFDSLVTTETSLHFAFVSRPL